MKIRNGFVSNSSSSSFIIIGNEKPMLPDLLGSPTLVVPDDLMGEIGFGWGPDKCTDIGSRINFAYLIALNKHKWIPMLEEVLKGMFCVSEIYWKLTDQYGEEAEGKVYGYIDHQSDYSGNPQNADMFKSKEALIQFIFAPDSYIQLDNDNH